MAPRNALKYSAFAFSRPWGIFTFFVIFARCIISHDE